MKIINTKPINLCPHTNALEFHRCMKCLNLVGCPQCTSKCDQCNVWMCKACDEHGPSGLVCGVCEKQCCDQCTKCDTCDKPLCKNRGYCVKTCNDYGCYTKFCSSHGTVCLEHSYTCEGCHKVFSGPTNGQDEYENPKPTPCSTCGKKLCPDCVTTCQFQYEYTDTLDEKFDMSWITKGMKALSRYDYEYDRNEKEYYEEHCKAKICKRGSCAKEHCSKYIDWRDRHTSVAFCNDHTKVPAPNFTNVD